MDEQRSAWGRRVLACLAALASIATIVTATVTILGDEEDTKPTAHDPGSTGPKTETDTRREAAPSPAGPHTTSDIQPARPRGLTRDVGLSKLYRDGDIEEWARSQVGSFDINGVVYNDALRGPVYPEPSDAGEIELDTPFAVTHMSFVVGIASDTECPRAGARVSVADRRDRILWGPKTVTLDSPASGSFAIDAFYVYLVQRTTAPSGAECNNGAADVVWGAVHFFGP